MNVLAHLHLVWRNLMRRKMRTALTLSSIFVSFVLFGVLTAVDTAFGVGIELAGLDRLIMIHKVSLIQVLPQSYGAKILADEGVTRVAHATWFGGVYQEPKNFFAQMAVSGEEYLHLYPEMQLPDERKDAWLRNRSGAIVGRSLANRFGWEVGDRVPLISTIWRKKDGSNWDFVVEGIYDAEKGFDTTQMFFHHEYLAQGTGVEGWVGFYVLRVAEPEQSAAVAGRLDALFANSQTETKTSTEKAFVQAFANQMGNIGSIVTGIVSVVFFTLLLVAGNAMAQSVRERTNELAVMKTLGFSDGKVMGLVLAESYALAVLGGAAGLGLVAWVTTHYDVGGALLPALYLPANGLVTGAGLVLVMGFLAAAVPSVRALRLNIADALRRS